MGSGLVDGGGESDADRMCASVVSEAPPIGGRHNRTLVAKITLARSHSHRLRCTLQRLRAMSAVNAAGGGDDNAPRASTNGQHHRRLLPR